jgi:hypothetical protein
MFFDDQTRDQHAEPLDERVQRLRDRFAALEAERREGVAAHDPNALQLVARTEQRLFDEVIALMADRRPQDMEPNR